MRVASLQHRSSSSITRAFTLIELLVVLGIITVVAALAVPLFSALTGAKSVEAGRNITAAIIGQARTIAVNEGTSAGVLFYIDPATEKTAMSIILLDDGGRVRGGIEDPDPYDKYKTFVPQQEYKASIIDATGTPQQGDRAISLTSDADATFTAANYNNPAPQGPAPYFYFGNYRPAVRVFRCLKDINQGAGAGVGVRPPRNGPYNAVYPGPTPGPAQPGQWFGTLSGPTYTPALTAPPSNETDRGKYKNEHWGLEGESPVQRPGSDFGSAAEQQLFPVGVSAQVIVEPITVNGQPRDRYVRLGAIMFDGQGRLTTTREFAIAANSAIGKSLGLTADLAGMRPGLGVVLYDTNNFKTDPTRTNGDYSIANSGTTTPITPALNTASHMYNLIGDAGATAPTVYPDDGQAATFSEEREEKWLDNNTTPLLINRYSGSLTETD